MNLRVRGLIKLEMLFSMLLSIQNTKSVSPSFTKQQLIPNNSNIAEGG